MSGETFLSNEIAALLGLDYKDGDGTWADEGRAYPDRDIAAHVFFTMREHANNEDLHLGGALTYPWRPKILSEPTLTHIGLLLQAVDELDPCDEEFANHKQYLIDEPIPTDPGRLAIIAMELEAAPAPASAEGLTPEQRIMAGIYKWGEAFVDALLAIRDAERAKSRQQGAK